MRDRLSNETGEETEARLQYMRDRVSNETGEEREARLQQMRTATLLLTPVLMPALLPEDSDFTGVHSEHRPQYMHTLSFLIFTLIQ